MALIAEHELPLPAEPYLWNRRERDTEVWRRERALDDAWGGAQACVMLAPAASPAHTRTEVEVFARSALMR